MANCHNLFQTFHKNISIDPGKKDQMLKSRDNLRERVRKHFRENHSGYSPKFYIQGSVKMKTGIRTKDDICDLDDGVYFFREPDVSATTLQTWVKEAVDGHTNTPPQHRKKCVRSIFAGDYDIDMPVYCKVDRKGYQLAVKNDGFEDSDSKAMVDWFAKSKDPNGTLVKMVKYQKAWCDHKRNQMPSGLAMTILATNAKNSIVYNDRDDITLKDTLNEIKKTLNQNFECIVPVAPGDDLFADYDQTRKDNFLRALDEFITDAEVALKEPNQLKASKLWQKHLGDRFPHDEDKNGGQKTHAVVIAGASRANPWAK